MKIWQKNEIECYNFLKEKYNYKEIVFSRNGGSNSAKNDIDVLKENQLMFSIEVKSLISQSGQFVVNSFDKKFIYSKLNKKEIDEESKSIINHLNANHEKYGKVTNKAIQISINEELSFAWIKNYYSRKKAYFIITKDNNNFFVFKTEKLEDYFDVKAFLRKKKSGSRNLTSDVYAKDVYEELIKNDFKSSNYVKDGKSFSFVIDTNSDKFILNGINNDYLLSRHEKNIFKARILSKTNNINVIFSIYFRNKSNLLKSNEDLDSYIKSII
jgi:hypothetical protein